MSAISPLTLHGSIPALVTPFAEGDPGSLDRRALARLAIRAVDRASSAIVVCGSTGEAPALSAEEHAEAIRVARHALGTRAPVIAGVGAPTTAVAVGLAVAAERAGASALLVSAPPYVRPPQEGLRAHVRAIAAASGLPIVLYDVPSRAAVAFADETIARLRDEGAIQGLKDATGDLARPARLRSLCGDDFVQLSGDDGSALAHRAVGGRGCISVTANVAPALVAAMHATWDSGDIGRARAIAGRLAPLTDLMFAESNPIPVKAALGLLGLCAPTLRLPLVPARAETVERLGRILARFAAEDEACPPALGRVV